MFVTVKVVVRYTPAQTQKSQAKAVHSLPLKGGAGILKTGNPPVVPLLPDRVVSDLSPAVADRTCPSPIDTFLAPSCSSASLTRWTGGGAAAVGGTTSRPTIGEAGFGSGGNGAGVGTGQVDGTSGSPLGTSTDSPTGLLVGGAGIRITGNFSPLPPPRISRTCTALLLAKSSSLPRMSQSHFPPPSVLGAGRRDVGGKRRTVIADTSGGGRCRDLAKGFIASNAAQIRDVTCGC